jgi:hypothetical protein
VMMSVMRASVFRCRRRETPIALRWGGDRRLRRR